MIAVKNYHWKPEFLPPALECVDRDLRRTIAEEEAFKTFSRHLASMEPDRPSSHENVVGGCAPLLRESSQSAKLVDVREAYRDTVMAVPHYEEEFDETLRENLGSEFPRDVASVLIDGDRLTPSLYDALHQTVNGDISERRALRKALDTERESLREVRDGIERIGDAVLSKCPPSWDGSMDVPLERAVEWCSTCDDLAEARQNTWQSGALPISRQSMIEGFYEYLYADLTVVYPALNDVVTLHTYIEERCRVHV